MKIAQVAPLYESVPPHGYGGTERVVSYLTEQLVREGHEVTLFASGDSQTAARLVACSEKGLRLNPQVKDHCLISLLWWTRFAAARTNSTCCTFIAMSCISRSSGVLSTAPSPPCT